MTHRELKEHTGTYELSRVTRRFGGPVKRALSGGTLALDEASASLPGGRVYGLIGRNGAGKTTLLRAMAGQLRVQGEVLVDGQPVWDNEAVLDRLILSGPDVPWPEGIKVRRLFAIAAARWEAWDQHYAEALIEDFDLDTSKRLSELSRGQKSLVSIVMGLAAQCPITPPRRALPGPGRAKPRTVLPPPHGRCGAQSAHHHPLHPPHRRRLPHPRFSHPPGQRPHHWSRRTGRFHRAHRHPFRLFLRRGRASSGSFLHHFRRHLCRPTQSHP